MSVDLNKIFNRPIVGFFDFRWKHTTWKFISFQMISYAFTAVSLSLTWHIGTSTTLRVELYIGTRLSCIHFWKPQFSGLTEEV